jgi:hypothetical protein
MWAGPGFVGTAACIMLRPFVRKGIQNYEHKIRYEGEYLFRAPPRDLEGARASEGP